MTEIEILQQENDKLKNELRQIKEDHKNQLTEARKNLSLTLHIASLKTEFDELPASVKDTVLKQVINKNLAADGAELTIGDTGQLVLRKKDGNTFFGQDNRALDPNSYFERVMEREKVLKNNVQPQPGKNTTQPEKPATGRHNQRNVLSNLVNESLQALTADKAFS